MNDLACRILQALSLIMDTPYEDFKIGTKGYTSDAMGVSGWSRSSIKDALGRLGVCEIPTYAVQVDHGAFYKKAPSAYIIMDGDQADYRSFWEDVIRRVELKGHTLEDAASLLPSVVTTEEHRTDAGVIRVVYHDEDVKSVELPCTKLTPVGCAGLMRALRNIFDIVNVESDD